MSSLPAPAIQALEQARPFAEHAAELAELEELGWRFGLTDARVFVAEGPDRGRRFDPDLGVLVARCTSRTPTTKEGA